MTVLCFSKYQILVHSFIITKKNTQSSIFLNTPLINFAFLFLIKIVNYVKHRALNEMIRKLSSKLVLGILPSIESPLL